MRGGASGFFRGMKNFGSVISVTLCVDDLDHMRLRTVLELRSMFLLVKPWTVVSNDRSTGWFHLE
jgi:hypothetical protein